MQTRRYTDDEASRKEAIRFATIDSTIALMSALFINAAILIVAAGTFHGTGYDHIADIDDAYKMLSPLLGTTMASVLFAMALLLSGQNATLTGTLAGPDRDGRVPEHPAAAMAAALDHAARSRSSRQSPCSSSTAIEEPARCCS